ncbi:MAG: histidine kinase, partial [Kibdelosporangium sp.]
VLAVGYIVVLHGPLEATSADWTLSMLSTLLITVQGRWPLTATLAQAVLMVGFSPADAELGMSVVTMAGCFALAELAWRRSGWPVWTGAAAMLIGNIAMGDHVFTVEMAQSMITVAAVVLLGMHLRSVQEIAWQAKERAAADAQAARAEERTAIARELHDLVAHHVASMVLRIGVARHVLDPDPKVAQVLDEVHASGTAAMADLRTLVTVLRDPAAEPVAATDLVAALRAAVQRVEAAGPTVRAEIDPRIDGLEAVSRLAVLRVVQEGLTNVLKHAGQQTLVSLRIELDAGAVEVSIVDSGPQRAEAGEPGHGLIGMRERVELAGGRLVTGPAGSGWRVRAWLPA